VHAKGYLRAPGVTLVAVADVNREAVAELAADLGVAGVYESYQQLLDNEHPDLLSICTPPGSHLEVTRAAVAAGVKAIHCEKPIALSYADALEMNSITREAGVQLTFNLQRRFEPVHRFAREKIVAGAIGDIVSVEGYCPNLPDWGTHVFDLIFFYLGDVPASWVIGQVDVSINRYVYNAFAETSSLTQVKWESGVTAVVMTGREPQTPVLNLENNTGIIVQGTKGRIVASGARTVVHRFEADDEIFETPFNTDPSTWERRVDPAIVECTAEAIADLVASLENGTEPVCSAAHGLAGAELIFSTYESSRSRRRVTLPLTPDDNALLSGLEAGFWQPTGEQRSTY
jgi:predicted dehydrogenase